MRIAPALALAALAFGACPPPRPPPPAAQDDEAAAALPPASVAFEAGPALGDLRAESVVLWAQGAQAATLHVEFWPHGAEGELTHQAAEAVDAADHAAQVRLAGLRPGTSYRYRAWFGAPDERAAPRDAATGRFRTAPRPGESAPVRFAFGGDLGG
ncbi:MAG: PhoD-like phosphatase N-terminal domain-containing protein, partial [Myxococcota bacterium]